MRNKAIALSAFLFLPAIALSSAIAAPQILGLIATAEPVPLTCADGVCTAEISSVCLQQRRDAPIAGTAYRPAEGTGITLIVTTRDGVKRSLPVEGEVTFSSLRIFLAVKVSLPEEMVRRLGDGAAMLSIAPMASIIPVAAEGDVNPIGRGEIAAYTAGPLRAAAEGAVGLDPARLEATRTLNQMINRLPENGAAGAEEIEPLWRRTVAADAALTKAKTKARPMNKAMTKAVVDGCRGLLQKDITPDLRSCLIYQHDLLAAGTTKDVWRALKPGS